MLAWISYAVVVGCLLTGLSLALDSFPGIRRACGRWLWAGALASRASSTIRMTRARVVSSASRATRMSKVPEPLRVPATRRPLTAHVR